MRRPSPSITASVLALVLLAAASATASIDQLAAAVAAPPAVQLRDVQAGDLAAGQGVVVGPRGRARAATARRAQAVPGARRTIVLPFRADMVGASWAGAAHSIELRARGGDRRWSRWVQLHADGDGPDPGSREARASRGRHLLAVPLWVGDAGRVQVRVAAGERGSVRELRIVAINAGGTATRRARFTTRLRQSAASVLGATEPVANAVTGSPGVRRRSVWGAAPPKVVPERAPALLGAVVHHTDSPNAYACSQVPALLRGIQRYHQRSNGWNDIGYNFLVDRCGRAWEGRAGGMGQAVVGAHTRGFNTGTVGIALVGTHGAARPSLAARRTLTRLVAWRLDLAHRSPTGTMVLQARSGDKFPVGSMVRARGVSGHRDLFPTACPGAMTYAQLRGVARAAWAHGGVKVANVTKAAGVDPETGALRGLVVRAVSNAPRPAMLLRVERISTGQLVHAAVHRGSSVAVFRWNGWPRTGGERIAAWDLRVRVEAVWRGTRARPWTGVPIEYEPDPGFAVVQAPTRTVTPDGDGAGETIDLAYELGTESRVGVRLLDAATGARVATLLATARVPASGAEPVQLSLAVPDSVAAGSYHLELGVFDDAAPWRSVERHPVIVVR